MTRAALGFTALCCVLLDACAPVPDAWKKVELAQLSTPDVVIEAKDGSFKLASGQVNTPFWAHDCPARATPENYDLGVKLGAQPVWVHYPGHDKPLHGLLSFCRIHPSIQGPVARLYDIRVPQEYIAATDAGRISVVFEPSGYSAAFQDGSSNVPAWVLWMSQMPFPGVKP
jgi:hypothetical protein